MKAKRSLRNAAQSAYYPEIFVGGGVRYAVAPHRTDQHSPFVVDNFNYFNGGVFLGLRQSFEWAMLRGELDQARAEYRELVEKERGASQGVRVDVKRGLLPIHDRRERIGSRPGSDASLLGSGYASRRRNKNSTPARSRSW